MEPNTNQPVSGEGGENSQSSDGQVESGSGDNNAAQDTADGDNNQQQPISKEEGGLEVVEKDGKHFIPEEAFQKRIDAIVAQRNEARTLLESIKTDPDVRREFLESLKQGGADDINPSEKEPPAPSAYQQFRDALPPEHKPFYDTFAKAIASEAEEHFERRLQETVAKEVAPLRSLLGEYKIKEFAKTNPEYPKYQSEIAKLMQSTGVNIEQAFILASHKDKTLSLKNAGAVEEKNRQANLRKTPQMGRNNSGGPSVIPTKKGGLDAAIERALANFPGQ